MQTNIHELGTIALNRLPIKIFILNNSGYLSIRISENTFFHGRLIGESNNTGLGFPVTYKIAAAYGINYFSADNNTKLKDIIPKVLDCPGPVLCEIACQKNQIIAPMVSSKRLADGTMISAPIDDMYPFLDKKELERIKIDLR